MWHFTLINKNDKFSKLFLNLIFEGDEDHQTTEQVGSRLLYNFLCLGRPKESRDTGVREGNRNFIWVSEMGLTEMVGRNEIQSKSISSVAGPIVNLLHQVSQWPDMALDVTVEANVWFEPTMRPNLHLFFMAILCCFSWSNNPKQHYISPPHHCQLAREELILSY